MDSQQTQMPITHIPVKMTNTIKHLKKNSISDNVDVSSYKNDNVLFQIHSPKGSDNYNAKTFPAKFSINITNQTNELNSGVYDSQKYINTDRTTGFQKSKKIEQPIRLQQNAQRRKKHTAKFGNTKDAEYYENQLKKYKYEYDRLASESEQNCDKYEETISQLQNSLQKSLLKIQKLQIDIEQLSQQNKNYLYDLTLQKKKTEQHKKNIVSISQQKQLLAQKIKKYGRQAIKHQTLNENYKNKIDDLEKTLIEKQQIIKTLNHKNNECYLAIMKQKQVRIDNDVKEMNKWLKGFTKTLGSYHSQQKDEYQKKIKDVLIKLQKFQAQNKNSKVTIQQLNKIIAEKDQTIYQFQKQIKKKSNCILQLEQQMSSFKIQNQQIKHKYQNILSHNLNNGLSQEFFMSCAGTVKVKMQLLLKQKDRHIQSLQNQIKSLKNSNLSFSNQIFKLEYQLKQALGPNLTKVRSQNKFNCSRQRQNSSYFGGAISPRYEQHDKNQQIIINADHFNYPSYQQTFTYDKLHKSRQQSKIRIDQSHQLRNQKDYGMIDSERSTNKHRRVNFNSIQYTRRRKF